MNRKQAIAAFKNFIAATNLSDADGQFEARITDWHKYGHSRTYFAMIERRSEWAYYKIHHYGYWDNVRQIYVPLPKHT